MWTKGRPSASSIEWQIQQLSPQTTFQSVVENSMSSSNANMSTQADTVAASIAASGDVAIAAINAAATAALNEAVTKITEAAVAAGDNTPAHAAGDKDAAVAVRPLFVPPVDAPEV